MTQKIALKFILLKSATLRIIAFISIYYWIVSFMICNLVFDKNSLDQMLRFI